MWEPPTGTRTLCVAWIPHHQCSWVLGARSRARNSELSLSSSRSVLMSGLLALPLFSFLFFGGYTIKHRHIDVQTLSNIEYRLGYERENNDQPNGPMSCVVQADEMRAGRTPGRNSKEDKQSGRCSVDLGTSLLDSVVYGSVHM